MMDLKPVWKMKRLFVHISCQLVARSKLKLDAVQSKNDAVLMISKYAFDTLILSSNSTESK